MKSLENIIVALDYENRDEAFRLVDTLGERITTYKIGPQLFTRSGPEVIQAPKMPTENIFEGL